MRSVLPVCAALLHTMTLMHLHRQKWSVSGYHHNHASLCRCGFGRTGLHYQACCSSLH